MYKKYLYLLFIIEKSVPFSVLTHMTDILANTETQRIIERKTTKKPSTIVVRQ